MTVAQSIVISHRTVSLVLLVFEIGQATVRHVRPQLYAMADPGFANGEGKVERRRREYRGAEGAEGVECGEGNPLPTGGDVWGGAVPIFLL